VGEVAVVGLPVILEAALGQRAILGGRCRVVVDVLEPELLTDFVFVGDARLGDGRSDADGRVAPLVTFHTTRFVAKAGDFET
jgi:hypothetical protein